MPSVLPPGKKYRHIFIDLDKTLWDFDSNSLETMREIFLKYDLKSRGIDNIGRFMEKYMHINEMLWSVYRKNGIKKEVLNIRRFEMTLNEFGIDDLIMATHIAEDYVTLSPLKNILFPHTVQALDYLRQKYPLHIITNGFEEVQQKKLDVCDLRKYFITITTSEEAGVKKPEVEIFNYALRKAGASPQESLMIGDDLKVDIHGAREIGMDTLFFNPSNEEHRELVNYEIRSWKEIQGIL